MEENLKKIDEFEKRIKKESIKLKRIFKNSNKKNMSKIEELINRASFLLVVSQDIERELKLNNNYTITTINASQTFTKPNPLLKEYRDTVKAYQAVIKQLDEMSEDKNNLPPPTKLDELEEFINK